MNGTPLVTAEDLTVRFGATTVLEHIDLEIYPQEAVALIGLNGAGKTTLLKTILGIHKPSSGSVTRTTRRIGYVPQRLNFDRTIPVTVRELLLSYGGTRPAIEEKLELAGARELIDARIGDLSGGQLQRVLLANALLAEPELLLLDEPTTGIDVVGERGFLGVIKALQDTNGVAIVLVSHDIHMVYRYASRVICINKRMMCQGPPHMLATDNGFKELFGDYLTPYEHEHR